MSDVAYITTSQVARKFHVSASAVRKWVAEGRIKPAIATPGGHYRFIESDIDDMLSGQVSA
ncbi:helix-turn-helix domain-containing protein [Mycobacterium sp. NAZ190054]|uniref:MerR family transcriptional regulator n=1 Tax=Mycobacterium sp. NAZ190054 TaxID=1747766 RepID=UPI0009EA79F3